LGLGLPHGPAKGFTLPAAVKIIQGGYASGPSAFPPNRSSLYRPQAVRLAAVDFDVEKRLLFNKFERAKHAEITLATRGAYRNV
jgi:hypothetical protein